MLTSENYVVDRKGKKVAVMVPVKEYQRLHDAAEELADIKAYDQVKKKKSDPIPIEQAFREIQESWKKRRK